MSADIVAELEALKAQYASSSGENSGAAVDPPHGVDDHSSSVSISRSPLDRASKREELRKKRAADRARLMAKAQSLRAQREERTRKQQSRLDSSAPCQGDAPSSFPPKPKPDALPLPPLDARATPVPPPPPTSISPQGSATSPQGPAPSPNTLKKIIPSISSGGAPAHDVVVNLTSGGGTTTADAADSRRKKMEDMKRRLAERKANREKRASQRSSSSSRSVSQSTAMVRSDGLTGGGEDSVSASSSSDEPAETDMDARRRQAKAAALRKLKQDLDKKRRALAQEKSQRDRTNSQLDLLIRNAQAKQSRGNSLLVPPTTTTTTTTAPPVPPPASMLGSASGKIGSLDDLQAALRAKKERNAAKRKSRIVRQRKRAEAEKRVVTKEERQMNRKSRIIKQEARMVERETAQLKINNQLGMLLQSMVQLEQAFMQQEKEKIEMKHNMGLIEAERDMYKSKCDSIHSTLRVTIAEMDHIKTSMDRLCKKYPYDKNKGRGAVLWNDLQERTATVTQARHKLHVATLKYSKDIKVAHEEQEKLVAERKESMEQEMMSPMRSAAAVNFSDLLSQIRNGTTLRAVDPGEVNADDQSSTHGGGAWRKSVMLVQSLQDTVRSAMDSRNLALSGLAYDSESSSEEFSDDEWEDDF